MIKYHSPPHPTFLNFRLNSSSYIQSVILSISLSLLEINILPVSYPFLIYQKNRQSSTDFRMQYNFTTRTIGKHTEQ